MFPITRLAIKVTKLERSAVKTTTKIYKNFGEKCTNELNELLKNQNLSLAYSKNPFKRMIIWVKTFCNNYKIIQNNIKTKLNALKEEYGDLFTKKRQKIAKRTIINNAKKAINDMKEELKDLKTIITEEVNKNKKA